MEIKDPNSSGSDPTGDQPTLDGIPASAPAALTARYDILGELGRGGMGIVYKARDRETGELVALKVLKPEIAADQTAMERFKNELRLARKITHKNVCRIHELLRFGDTVAIAMEYVEGQSLRAVLQSPGGVALGRGMDWLGKICAALAEAHTQGVVHRDLKPENILIARDGTVKLMDFGIARLAGAGATLTAGITGTPAYMSPEQASGKEADARSDLYSLGLVMYEMFTGQPAFRADTPVALALKQIQETPPPPREINPYLPEFLDRAVRKCLEKDAAKRFQSVEELESAIKPAADVAPGPEPGTPAEIEPLLPLVESVQWQPRDSWLLGGGLLAAIVFLALFSRVYPYASLRIRIGPDRAAEKAVALVRKFEPAAASGRAEPFWRWSLGAQPTAAFVSLPEIQQAIVLILKFQPGSRWWLAEYPVKVSVLGLAEANRQLVYGEYWDVRVDLGPGRVPAWVALRTDGSLHSLRVPPQPGNKALSPPSPEQAARDASNYVRQAFGTDVSNLEPKLHRLSQATDISWELPGPIPDLMRFLRVRIGREGLMEIWEHFASRHQSEIQSHWEPSLWQEELLRLRFGLPGGLALLFTLLLMLGLFFGRRLYQKAGRSAILAALCVTLGFGGIWLQDHEEAEFAWLQASAVAVAIFLVHFFLFATAEDYLWRRLRSRVVTWFLLVRRPGEARAAGLSILRGCALGFIFLAAHTLLVYALGSARLAGPSTLWLEAAALNGRPYLPLYALSYAVLATIPKVWCLFGFPAALASGISRRSLMLVGVPAALCAFMVFWLPGTAPSVAWVALFFAALQGLVFSLIFCRYDLLTLACAIFTVEVWLLVYPVWAILSAIQPLQSSLAMMPWFLLLLAGAVIYLRPQLQAARRHIGAVFE